MTATYPYTTPGRHKAKTVTVLVDSPVGEMSLAVCQCPYLPQVFSGDSEVDKGCPFHHPRAYANRNAEHRRVSRVYDTFIDDEEDLW